jgi:molybdopterin converting factor small subunit
MIQVHVKLMGMLKEKTPDGGMLELADGATVAAALERLQIPPESVQLFTLNCQLVRDPNRPLAANDELTILPPVGGG